MGTAIGAVSPVTCTLIGLCVHAHGRACRCAAAAK